jgi:exodeoxyribonuclease III
VKIISWNVNGIRAAQKKGLLEFVREQDPDILCLQETRAPRSAVDSALINGHSFFINEAEKAGYSGTAILTKQKPLSVKKGLGIPKHDHEGRVITAEYNNFYLVNVYVPNSKRELTRLPYREKEWDPDFLNFLKILERTKPVVFCGDMNVAHKPIDLTNPEKNEKTHGFTAEERAGFDNIVKAGFIDTFREIEDGSGHYTWWSQFRNCRQRNIGWRIDYFCISKSLKTRLEDAFILDDVMGSDHCPIGLELALS